MPYIAIHAKPKDPESTKRVAERISQVLQEEWGTPTQAITISYEEFAPSDWEKVVVKGKIQPKEKYLLIRGGKKTYE